MRELRFDRIGGGVLHDRIERRVDEKPAVIDLIGREEQIQIPLHRVHRIVLLDQGETARMRIDLFVFRLLRPARRVIFFRSQHPIEHRVALHRGAFRILERRKTIRAANQSGEQSRFRKIQLRRVFPEIGVRRGLDSVTTGAEIDPVHVKLEDLVLGEFALDAQGDHRLEQVSG